MCSSSPSFEAQLRNLLSQYPLITDDVSDIARLPAIAIQLESEHFSKSGRFVAGDFIFGEADPPKYWNCLTGLLMPCENPFPDIGTAKNSKRKRGAVTHQSLLKDLAKRIGNIVLFATIDMLPKDILQLLPEEIIQMHFPAPGATPAFGKKKKIKIPDLRQSLWIDVGKHKNHMRSAVFTVATDLVTNVLEDK
jgi:hypothetical protein